MNAKVHPLVVVLVVFLTLLAIGVWIWGSGEAKSVGGPAGLRTDADGHLYIQIQNQLLEHDAEGVFLQRHDLARLGVDTLLGGIGFFSNGDILVRRGPDPRTLSQKLRAYQRRTNEQALTPVSTDTGLHRCNLDSATCELFGTDAVDFKAAHAVFIDRQSDDVYISDTTRHLLRKYSATGEPLAVAGDGFRFPNHIALLGGQLFVANTNHHQVRKLDPRSDSFGEEIDSFSIQSADAIAAGQVWPSHFARVGDAWWVNNMRSDMSEGGIYIFDDSWGYDRKISLPAGADPISILPFRDVVLISDWNNDRIYRFSSGGIRLDDFVSPGLDEVVAESRKKRLQFRIYGYAGIALFLFVLLGLIVRMLASKEPVHSSSLSTAGDRHASNAPDESIRLQPDQKMIRKVTIALRMAMILTIVVAILLVFLIVLSGNIRVGIVLLLPVGGLAAICALIAWAGRASTGTAIHVSEKTITLQDHNGRESTCPIRDVVYDQTAIATPEIAVFLGQPHLSIYDRKTLNDQLFPRLAEAQHVSVWRMQSTLFKRRHPQGLSLAIVLFGIVVGAVWTLFRNQI